MAAGAATPVTTSCEGCTSKASLKGKARAEFYDRQSPQELDRRLKILRERYPSVDAFLESVE